MRVATKSIVEDTSEDETEDDIPIAKKKQVVALEKRKIMLEKRKITLGKRKIMIEKRNKFLH